jgi:hypothetical protein
MSQITESTMLVTEKTAARILGTTEKTLQQWRHYRRGPSYHKAGRCVRYSMDDLKSYMASCRVEIEG